MTECGVEWRSGRLFRNFVNIINERPSIKQSTLNGKLKI